MNKIALEEHFMMPSFVDYFAETKANISEAFFDRAVDVLSDFGERRLAAMDKGGIERAILSLSGPGVQVERDTARAIAQARACNDFLAEKVAAQPDRYGGFAHLAMQDAKAAADEYERCVRDLGFNGALINGQTGGVYLDDDRYGVFWERVDALGMPVYIHPGNPPDHPAMYDNHPELVGPMWSWTVETSAHALRLVFAGVFERFPNAKLILGHMGETLPFHLWRFDSRWDICRRGPWRLEAPPSAYIKRNIKITTAGVCAPEALVCSLAALGEDNVMFSVDYPFESTELATQFIDDCPLDEAQRAKVCRGNAEKLMKLKSA